MRGGHHVNISEDKVTILDKYITLSQSTKSHYCRDTLPNFSDNEHTKNLLELIQVDKIHKELEQGSVNATEKLLKNANFLHDEISALIKEAVNHSNK